MAWTLWVRELLTVYPIPRCMLIRHLFATVVSFPWTCSHTSWGVPFRVYVFLGSSHTEPQLGVLRCLWIGDAIYVTGSCYWLKVNPMLRPSVIFQPWTMDSSGSFSWKNSHPEAGSLDDWFWARHCYLSRSFDQVAFPRSRLLAVASLGGSFVSLEMWDLKPTLGGNVLDQKGMDSLPIGSMYGIFTIIYLHLPYITIRTKTNVG